MKTWPIKIGVCAVGLLPFELAGQVLIESVHIGRGSVYYQTSADTMVPAGDVLETVTSYGCEIGIEFSSEGAFGVRVSGPGFPEGLEIPLHEEETLEYQVEPGFETESELLEYMPVGTYTFSWWEGATWMTESLALDAYDPLMPKRLINYDALQSIDTNEPVIISWEPFEDLDGKIGFLEILVLFTDQWRHVIWTSDELIEDGFGVDPEITSIELPGELLTLNPAGIYQIEIVFNRIEWIGVPSTNPEGLKGVVSTTETIAPLLTKAAVPGRIFLTYGEWNFYDDYGWIYGFSPDWGYSYDLGWFYVGYTPGYIYQSNMGWLMPMPGKMKDGRWFYCFDHGWIFTAEGYGGWYQDLDGNSGNMIEPTT